MTDNQARRCVRRADAELDQEPRLPGNVAGREALDLGLSSETDMRSRAATSSEHPQHEVRRIRAFRGDGHIRTLQDIEAEVFAIAVRSTGSVTEASRQLGVSRNTIYRRGK